MKVLSNEYKDRLSHWMRALSNDFYLPLGKISFEAACTVEELRREEAMKLSFIPVEQGYTWGNQWEYCWFRGTITLPKEAEGKRIALDLQTGGESTIFINGKEFGTYRSSWVEVPHHYIEDNFITTCGHEGETYDILMETYAGHDYPDSWSWATGPVLPGMYEPRKENHDRAVLANATFGIWNEEAYQLFMDADTLQKLLAVQDDTSLRAAKIAEALENFTLIADPEQPLEDRIVSYKAAREKLAPVLAAVNGSTVPEFYAIGNAHLDLAWLWPMAETYRKTARTFAAQLRLIEQYPGYRFLQSQPASYEMCRQWYPDLFDRIREAIKDGRWIAEGAMWVEPDTNMSGGEALIRQLMYGLDYYKNVLGVKSVILWLPDTFGYSGALPQILKKSGVKYLVTQKIYWSYNGGERFPYHYFNWEGIDGTQVTAFLPTSYTYDTDPETIAGTWSKRSQARDLDAFLYPFGYGDGGGGPARDHIEYICRESNLEGMPKVKMAGPVQFFEDMEAKGGPKNTWQGELYFDAHRGTYTTQAKVKENNRRAEGALHEMEFWAAAAGLAGHDVDHDAHVRLWKELLLHQFHDILPGSSIHRVYEEAEKRVGAVIDEAKSWAEGYAESLTEKDEEAYSVFNSLSFERQEIVVLPERFKAGAVTADGTAVPVETEEDGVKALVNLPSAGALVLYPGTAAETPTAKAYASADGFVLENEVMRAVINKDAEITSLRRKDSGREYAAAPMNHFRFFKDVPRKFDAWDIDSMYREQELPGARDIVVSIGTAEGLCASLNVSGKIGESEYSQKITLTAGAERIEFHTLINWKELHRLLKVSFPIDVHVTNGINEIQFGYVERPVHRSRQYDKDRFEVCNHRYSVLADGSHGAAVLNNSKYGISMNGNALELTLLRAAASPDMRTDNRRHEFVYAIAPFEGPFSGSNIVRQGLALNNKPITAEGKAVIGSLVSIDCGNVIMDTLKPAEDGSSDIIMRFYESQNAAVHASVRTAFEGKAYMTNLLENVEKEIPFEKGCFELDFGVFEIHTVRIRKP
ncbi:MAG: alpha-mannosidase [Solobacterium sp.]|nr:alpha-mannosidase [Solobacterium sp.]